MVDRLNGVHSGLGQKAPCRAATTANITLSGEQTIDGVAVVDGDRVLVKDQTATAENGIYVASSGVWTRATDFDGARDVAQGTMVFVYAGTTNALTEFTVTTADPVPGSAMAFTSQTVTTAELVDSSVTTAKIADDNVTNAKLANMAAATIKGRASGAGTGDPTDLTADQTQTILDGATTPYLKKDGSVAMSGALQLPEISTPSTPSSGWVKLYAKSDNKLYRKDDTGVEQVAGGGPSYGLNSILRYNAQTISEDITVEATSNASTVGPVTIASTYTVTIASGGTWAVL